MLDCYSVCLLFFFFKQKTAYEMRISDWSSDVCSSDLLKRTTASNWLLPGTALPLAKAGWPGAAPAGPGWDWARLGGRVVAEDCARLWAKVSAVPPAAAGACGGAVFRGAVGAGGRRVTDCWEAGCLPGGCCTGEAERDGGG